MGYNGSNRKGYDVRYRGFPKSSMRSVDRIVFGRHGILIGAAKLVKAGIKDITSTPSYSKSRSSGSYYTFKTSSGIPQKRLLDIDLQRLSNEDYSGIIANYYERKKKHELQRERESVLLSTLSKKKHSLYFYSLLKFIFKRRIPVIISEIDYLSKELDAITQQPIDVSFRLDNVSAINDQCFIDSFMHLFQDTKISVISSSEAPLFQNEIPSFCHFYEISRESISINTEEGPLSDSNCCSISFGNLVLFFYSNALIISNSVHEISVINYEDITLSHKSVSIVEDHGFSTYNYYVCGREYLHEKKDGGPDLRYSYNPRRPIIGYHSLVMRHKKRIIFCFVSNIEKQVKDFISAFKHLKMSSKKPNNS